MSDWDFATATSRMTEATTLLARPTPSWPPRPRSAWRRRATCARLRRRPRLRSTTRTGSPIRSRRRCARSRRPVARGGCAATRSSRSASSDHPRGRPHGRETAFSAGGADSRDPGDGPECTHRRPADVGRGRLLAASPPSSYAGPARRACHPDPAGPAPRTVAAAAAAAAAGAMGRGLVTIDGRRSGSTRGVGRRIRRCPTTRRSIRRTLHSPTTGSPARRGPPVAVEPGPIGPDDAIGRRRDD